MRKLVLALLALLACAPAWAQTEYFAHAGDTVNTGATTDRIWCSPVLPVPGRGSISVATNGNVTASDPTAFAGMTVDAIHASAVYKRTGIYYFAPPNPLRNFGTVTVKTSNTAITITDGARSPLTATNTTSWGYWVTTCQRLATASGVNYDPNVWGVFPPSYPSLTKTRNTRFWIATFFNLYHTPDTLTTSVVAFFIQPAPGWTQNTAVTSFNPAVTPTTQRPVAYAQLNTALAMNDTPVSLSVPIVTSTTNQDRWIVALQPY